MARKMTRCRVCGGYHTPKCRPLSRKYDAAIWRRILRKNPRGMTLKQAKDLLRSYGMALGKRDGEYRVNLRGGSEASAYYTDDLKDAVDTARHMAGSRQSRNPRRESYGMYRKHSGRHRPAMMRAIRAYKTGSRKSRLKRLRSAKSMRRFRSGRNPASQQVGQWKITRASDRKVWVDGPKWSDSGVLWPTGQVAYDFPERVPLSVKQAVRKMLKSKNSGRIVRKYRTPEGVSAARAERHRELDQKQKQYEKWRHLYYAGRYKAQAAREQARGGRNPLPRWVHRKSIRTIYRGKGRKRRRILVGCPKRSWAVRKKRCRKGMRLVEKKRVYRRRRR